MNKRRESRFQADQLVAITLFGETDIKLSAIIKNVSGRGIGFEFEGPVAIGTALKIALDDSLLLGEVIYCRRDEASFYVGVQLEEALTGLAELSRMVNAFAVPVTPSDSRPQETHAVIEGSHRVAM